MKQPISKKRDVPEPKAKTMKPDVGGQRDRGTGGDQGDKKEIPPCRFFLTDSGCRKGRGCRFNHDLKDEKRRCYHCGSPDHLAPQCNVIKEMEVVFVKKPLRLRRTQTRMMHHLLDLNPMFNPTPTRNQFRRFLKRQIDF